MMRSLLCPMLAFVVIVGVATGAKGDITPDEVRQAIRRGVEFLLSRQARNGSWGEYENQPGGVTSLCTLALINSGQPVDSPPIRRALEELRRIQPDRTYSVALQTMVFCAASPQQDRLQIRRNVEWLEKAMFRYDSSVGPAGAWGYTLRPTAPDNSNTQFALLALYEAERLGVQLGADTWERIANHWRSLQAPDGSWPYRANMRGTGSMTCAGIASMVIASGRTSMLRARVNGQTIQCCGATTESDDWKRIDNGLKWLARHFSVRVNPGDVGGLLYYLYGVERVGRLTGQRFIGSHDWYREGADYLVQMQAQQIGGHWRGSGLGEGEPTIGTSLALLFLSKGRRPIVVGKLQYGDREQWDYHAAGIPHLVQEVEKSWKKELTWQSVDLRAALPEQLLESPVLFLTGSQAMRFDQEDVDKLRAYIEQGGFIFAEAREGNGCDGKAFDASFRELVGALFPDSSLRLLPPEHPVWYADGKVDPKYMRPLLGLDACCRTSIVYCPQNLSCFWELSDIRSNQRYPQPVQEELSACMQIGKNVIAYATNKVLKDKLERPQIAVGEDDLPETNRGVVQIAKLAHAGGSDDAPRALPNLVNYVRQEMQMRLRAGLPVAPTDPRLYEYPILFMQGRFDFQFSPEQRRSLRQYLENGGVLFADAICANPQFAAAFQREMAAIFPEYPLQRIPLDHELFSTRVGGFDLQRVTLNDPQSRVPGEGLASRRASVSPVLEGIEIDGRLAVIFSPYDLSCALENHNSPECKGYVKEDALRIGLNAILYAMQQ